MQFGEYRHVVSIGNKCTFFPSTVDHKQTNCQIRMNCFISAFMDKYIFITFCKNTGHKTVLLHFRIKYGLDSF